MLMLVCKCGHAALLPEEIPERVVCASCKARYYIPASYYLLIGVRDTWVQHGLRRNYLTRYLPEGLRVESSASRNAASAQPLIESPAAPLAPVFGSRCNGLLPARASALVSGEATENFVTSQHGPKA